jgi:hypothetical protein
MINKRKNIVGMRKGNQASTIDLKTKYWSVTGNFSLLFLTSTNGECSSVGGTCSNGHSNSNWSRNNTSNASECNQFGFGSVGASGTDASKKSCLAVGRA